MARLRRSKGGGDEGRSSWLKKSSSSFDKKVRYWYTPPDEMSAIGQFFIEHSYNGRWSKGRHWFCDADLSGIEKVKRAIQNAQQHGWSVECNFKNIEAIVSAMPS